MGSEFLLHQQVRPRIAAFGRAALVLDLAVQGEAPYALNLDASRLIYDGSPAAGGGHDDVYKDDVIHMLWAINQL